MTADTLVKLLVEKDRKYGEDRVAIRRKERGIWKEYTWRDYYEMVKYLSYGLLSLGLKPGQELAILGDNDPEWYVTELATQAIGACPVGIFADCSSLEVEHILKHADVTFLVANDQEQVDKVWDIRDRFPLLDKVIYWDPKGLWDYDDPMLLYFYDVIELGKQFEAENHGLFEDMVKKTEGDDICVICYTSGTTGEPKGITVSYNNILGTAKSLLALDPWLARDDYVSYIPPAWMTEQYFGMACGLLTDAVINFPENSRTVNDDIREIGPTTLMFSAKLWESMASTIQAKINNSDSIKRFFYRLILPIGYKKADFLQQGKGPNILWRILFSISESIMFRRLRDKIGLLRIMRAYTAGSDISRSTIKFFHAIGVNLKQIYGNSEGGICIGQPDNKVSYHTVGFPLPGCRVKISHEGEVFLKGPGAFIGYYRNPELTKQIITEDGYIATGDAGYLTEDGQLVFWGRLADLKTLPDGSKFSPTYIEAGLRFSPYINDTLVIGGDGMPFVSALIDINYENTGQWAEARSIPYTSYVDLSQRLETYQLIVDEIREANKLLPESARINRYVLMHKEFDADEGELTRTRKLRRAFVYERYKDLIEAIYKDKTEFFVEVTISYRDGTERIFKRSVRIASMEGP